MSIGVKGNYLLRLKFGDSLIPMEPSLIEQFAIIQDMNKFLPSFRIKIADSAGTITHQAPSDRNMTNVLIETGKDASVEPENSYNFTVFRKFPVSEFAASAVYDIDGLLSMSEPLFAPDYCRSFTNKTVKEVLEYIAIDELGCDTVDISPSLAYTKLIVQPNWSNGMLLNDLMKRLIGNNNESAFKCIIRRRNRKSEFIFRSVDELCKYQQPVAKYVVNDEPFQDYLPVYDYSIFDNYRLFGIFGSKKQSYKYFDYYNTQFVTSSEQYSDLYSLSDYFMIDGNDSENSDTIIELGRNNEFTRDFKGNVRASYHTRLIGLVKMWIVVWGNSNIVPGQLIQLLFGHGLQTGNPYSYQYSGFWLVEKVVHTFGDTFRTRLLLTRNGIDTDVDTTLLKATTKKQ